MRVRVPSPLEDYTRAREVQAAGDTVDAVLHDLDRRFPGMRFRMVDEQQRVRAHIRLYVNREPVTQLSAALRSGDELLIVAALSGG
ncbi:MAG: MoaD/ThiS family protein [Betaproteobacteria bacterium]|nr:MoaD/ThiS family protein [Betaproteobacteria bacterium]